MNVNHQPAHQPALLLIEDDELVRDAMTRLFVREGYLVLTAGTGHDAMGVLRTSPVDVVLLDVGLPDVSGADLCARLRQFFPHMPVVVCSGAASPQEADELRQLGITHFFCKPIAMPDLIAAVRSALDNRPAPPPAGLN
jgi:two-component system catabolic regulation response regulator CreB